jgi:RsiW-degrading membrane proteinase PrsW (M82 family)
METLILWLLLASILAIYFLPSLIARKRRHPQGNAILALNFLLGWTFLGWVAALVWSLTALPQQIPGCSACPTAT